MLLSITLIGEGSRLAFLSPTGVMTILISAAVKSARDSAAWMASGRAACAKSG